MDNRTNNKTVIAVVVLAALAVALAITAWWKLHHVTPQPKWISENSRDSFFYGSVGAENTEGIPYWLWLAMPRMFPDYMPGPGGYASLGMSWQEGREMPVGFAKQNVGYVRVTGNCALCHAVSYFHEPDQAPTIVAAVPGRATDMKPLYTFFQQSAKDPRFNADEFFSEIDTATKLSFLDRLIYRYVLIPRARQALMRDPSQVLLDSALRVHAQDPSSEAPFNTEQMKALRAQMKALETPAQP